jgi:hypothetical protein
MLHCHLHFISCKYLPAFSSSHILLLLNNLLCLSVATFYFLLAACMNGWNLSREKSCGTSVQGRAMIHAMRPFTAEARIPSHASPHEICSERSDTKGGFIPSTSLFPCQQHSTNTPHTFHSSAIDHYSILVHESVAIHSPLWHDIWWTKTQYQRLDTTTFISGPLITTCFGFCKKLSSGNQK